MLRIPVENPYRLLFSVGCLSGLLGVSMWFLYAHQWLSFYPRQAHAQILFFAFFWSFVAGFLLTAIPRMTGSALATSKDVAICILLIALQCVINFRNLTMVSPYIHLLQSGFLIYFILPRFLQKKKIPFDGFLFFPAAFLMSFSGVGIYMVVQDPRFIYVLAGEAFLLNLILGLGSRLVPALCRLPNAFMHPTVAPTPQWRAVILKVLLLNISFIVELMGFFSTAYLLRFFVVSYVAVTSWGLFKKATIFSFVGWGLKLATLFMMVGYFCKAILVSYSGVASSHLVYLGGFTLLTLMVAMRVTLAHSGGSLDYELRGKKIALVISLLVLAALFRWMSGSFIVGVYIDTSIILFCTAVMLWLGQHLSLQWRLRDKS